MLTRVLAGMLTLVLARILTGVLARLLPRILTRIRRWRRAIMAAIVSVVVAAVVGPPIAAPMLRLPMSVMIWRRWLPGYRGLHKGLTGSGHGRIGVAPPLVAIGINLRRYKERAVILLLRRSRRHYRSNNIAGLRIAVLGGDAPVVVIFAL